jgi:type IV pilus assembly protein PilB
MAVSTNRVPLSGLARKLVMDGLLAEEAAAEAFQESLSNKVPFVKQLVESNLVDAKSIAHAASSEFGVPLIDIDAIEVDADTIKLVSRDLVQKHGALPLYKRGTRIFIGVADPTNLQALDEIKFNIGGGTTEAVVVEWDKLAKVIDKALEDSDTSLGDMDDGDLEDFDDVEVGTTEPDREAENEIDDAPVVRFVNKCLLDAIK